MYVSFIDLEKVYDRVNREALCQVLIMYDMGVKLLSGIMSMYVDISICVRVKRGESEQFRINSGVRRVYHVSLAVQCIYRWSDEGGETPTMIFSVFV